METSRGPRPLHEGADGRRQDHPLSTPLGAFQRCEARTHPHGARINPLFTLVDGPAVRPRRTPLQHSDARATMK
ncbi:hypothetical protein SCMC78_00550 [Streptomyces sp. CMC78]|uniref:Uncharacterized protein n=1 Tax=Streptomyces sp. CMC78 TaxID=3231512 RepID=A0AB33K4X5_9ACTN